MRTKISFCSPVTDVLPAQREHRKHLHIHTFFLSKWIYLHLDIPKQLHRYLACKLIRKAFSIIIWRYSSVCFAFSKTSIYSSEEILHSVSMFLPGTFAPAWFPGHDTAFIKWWDIATPDFLDETFNFTLSKPKLFFWYMTIRHISQVRTWCRECHKNRVWRLPRYIWGQKSAEVYQRSHYERNYKEVKRYDPYC